MAKSKKAPEPGSDQVKTSVTLARATHARLSAIASLRGCSLNAILNEAADEIAKGLILVDKRKSPDQGIPTAGVRDRLVTPVESDDSEDGGSREAA
jgi:hypothetical protein